MAATLAGLRAGAGAVEGAASEDAGAAVRDGQRNGRSQRDRSKAKGPYWLPK